MITLSAPPPALRWQLLGGYRFSFVDPPVELASALASRGLSQAAVTVQRMTTPRPDRTPGVDALLDALNPEGWTRSDMPEHALRRAGALVGNDEILHIDEHLTREQQLVSGRLVIFTRDRVIVVDLDQAPDFDRPDETRTTVQATTFPRHDLDSIDIAESRRRDLAWVREYGTSWGRDRQLALHYRGRDPLTLPLNPDGAEPYRQSFAKLVPELLRDLANTGPDASRS